MYFKVHEVFAGELKTFNEILERFWVRWKWMEMNCWSSPFYDLTFQCSQTITFQLIIFLLLNYLRAAKRRNQINLTGRIFNIIIVLFHLCSCTSSFFLLVESNNLFKHNKFEKKKQKTQQAWKISNSFF